MAQGDAHLCVRMCRLTLPGHMVDVLENVHTIVVAMLIDA